MTELYYLDDDVTDQQHAVYPNPEIIQFKQLKSECVIWLCDVTISSTNLVVI